MKKEKKALIIVDVQNDFCKGGSLEVPNANEIISYINKIQDNYDYVVTTQDYHPINHKSFASNHGKNEGEIISLNGIDQILWAKHCVQGSFGADFHKDLNLKGTYNFKKGMNVDIDSYSGFFDNKKNASTGLHEFLKNKKINSLDIVGLALEYCVQFTAVDANKLGYDTRVLLKGTKYIKEDDAKNAILNMKNLGISIL